MGQLRRIEVNNENRLVNYDIDINTVLITTTLALEDQYIARHVQLQPGCGRRVTIGTP